MTDSDRFTRQTVETLAKRAAYRCSNPDCRTLTAGPAEEDHRSIVLGEAAHIYGANPGSARYDSTMDPAERSAITNAIWLCRNCHKAADADALRFPAALLFDWRREHEREVALSMGRTGERLWQLVLEEEAAPLRQISRAAQQIVIDKPSAWEYRLTAEILKQLILPLQARWEELKRGLYVRRIKRVSSAGAMDWTRDRLTELESTAPALDEIINVELKRSWGPPGQHGSSAEILRVCRLFEESCIHLLAVEEDVRFTRLQSPFDAIREVFTGVAGRFIDQVSEIPRSMIDFFSADRQSGELSINIIIDLPDGWADKYIAILNSINADVVGESYPGAEAEAEAEVEQNRLARLGPDAA